MPNFIGETISVTYKCWWEVQIDCWLGSGRKYAVHKRVRIRVRIKNDRQFIFQAYTECGRHG